MTERKVPVQSLIDHIKTAVDVDPWAKEMAEELLKEQEAVNPKQIGQGWFCGACDSLLSIGNEKMVKFCSMCGKHIKWE